MGRPDLGTRERVGERSGCGAGKRETTREESSTGLRKVLPPVREKRKVLFSLDREGMSLGLGKSEPL
jgi:hypothetical protein